MISIPNTNTPLLQYCRFFPHQYMNIVVVGIHIMWVEYHLKFLLCALPLMPFGKYTDAKISGKCVEQQSYMYDTRRYVCWKYFLLSTWNKLNLCLIILVGTYIHKEVCLCEWSVVVKYLKRLFHSISVLIWQRPTKRYISRFGCYYYIILCLLLLCLLLDSWKINNNNNKIESICDVKDFFYFLSLFEVFFYCVW